MGSPFAPQLPCIYRLHLLQHGLSSVDGPSTTAAAIAVTAGARLTVGDYCVNAGADVPVCHDVIVEENIHFLIAKVIGMDGLNRLSVVAVVVGIVHIVRRTTSTSSARTLEAAVILSFPQTLSGGMGTGMGNQTLARAHARLSGRMAFHSGNGIRPSACTRLSTSGIAHAIYLLLQAQRRVQYTR